MGCLTPLYCNLLANNLCNVKVAFRFPSIIESGMGAVRQACFQYLATWSHKTYPTYWKRQGKLN